MKRASSFRKSIFNPVILNVITAGFVVFSMTINTLVPRFSIEQKEYDLLSQILQSQSSLICFFSFSSIPMRIVGDLFEGQRNSAKESNKKKNSKESNANQSDFTAISLERASENTRLERQSILKPLVAPSLLSVFYNPNANETGPTIPAQSVSAMVFLLILMLIMMSPRSVLPEASIKININTLART